MVDAVGGCVYGHRRVRGGAWGSEGGTVFLEKAAEVEFKSDCEDVEKRLRGGEGSGLRRATVVRAVSLFDLSVCFLGVVFDLQAFGWACGEVFGLGDDAGGSGVESIAVAGGAHDGVGSDDGVAAFTDFVLLGVCNDLRGALCTLLHDFFQFSGWGGRACGHNELIYR